MRTKRPKERNVNARKRCNGTYFKSLLMLDCVEYSTVAAKSSDLPSCPSTIRDATTITSYQTHIPHYAGLAGWGLMHLKSERVSKLHHLSLTVDRISNRQGNCSRVFTFLPRRPETVIHCSWVASFASCYTCPRCLSADPVQPCT